MLFDLDLLLNVETLRRFVQLEPLQVKCVESLRSAHTMGLVPATSPCNKLQGLVASCELTILAAKSSRRDQNLVPATSPTNSNWFDFVGLVAGTKVGLCD